MLRNIELNPHTVKKYIDLHKKMQIPFTITISNYTTLIESNFIELKFMKNAQSNRTFAAYQKVKSEVVKKELPSIDIAALNYFTSNIFPTDFYAERIYNIDLKAAYATVLLNDGFISKETYRHLLLLPKMERLACVGMLAGKKLVFEIDENGKAISEKTIVSPTSNYFFYCVHKTFEIMSEARLILEEDFLFTWVDGIYFLDGKEKKNYFELDKYFDSVNFNVSFEHLKEFYVKNYNSYYACSYLKDGKKKLMNVPKQQNSIVKDISSYLLTKDW